MTWNWQQEDWPRFSWDEHRLRKAEALFAEGAGIVIGVSKHLSAADRSNLSVELMSYEAVDTSAIGGETLDRDSVQSPIRKHLGLADFSAALSAANYMTITGAPPAAITRHLAALVSLGALLRTGEHKATRYRLAVALDPIESVTVADIA